MHEHDDRTAAHPVHAIALAGTLPLFLGAWMSDQAYASSEQIQWANFAQWLLAGGLVFAAVALLCALVALLRGNRTGRGLAYLLVLVAMWGLGFIDSLVHARDAWAMMPTGPVLSAIVLLLCIAALWLGFGRSRTGAAP